MTPSPTGRIYNVVRDTPDERDVKMAMPSIGDIANIPDSFDLRTQPGRVPPVWDQGREGSCTAHGNGATFEIARQKIKLPAMMPSRQFIYREERLAEGALAQDSGAQVRTGIQVMANIGVPPEYLFPYDPANFSATPPPEVYAEALNRRVVKYTRVAATPETMCAALATDQAVVFGFVAYSSLDSLAVANTGVLDMPKWNETINGGHCVCAVGYVITKRGGPHGGTLGPLLDVIFGKNQLEGYLIVRNSWGIEWGQAGYFTMPFGYLRNKLVSDCWVVDAGGL